MKMWQKSFSLFYLFNSANSYFEFVLESLVENDQIKENFMKNGFVIKNQNKNTL